MPTKTTTATTEHASLAEALVAVQSQMPTVAKSKTADTGSYSYKYADLASIQEAILPLLTAHGLSFVCRPQSAGDGSYELVGVLTHTCGETLEGSLPLFGRKAQDLGSSITYARRYLLGALTGIVTEDDDDARHVAEAPLTRRQPPPPDPLETARATAWRAFIVATEEVPHNDELRTREGFIATYEQHTAQPFTDALPGDLDGFTDALRRGEVAL